MKKLIVAIILCVSFCSVFAQERDSTELKYNPGRNTQWREVSGFPIGVTNDSLIAYIDSVGRFFMRNNKNKKVFTLQEAGIVCDGATDQTAKLNWYFQRSYVRGLEVSYDFSGVKLIVNGTVNTQGKALIFDGSIEIGGTGTFSTGTKITAPAYSKIFDNTINLIRPKTSDGYFYPQWYGAVADGTTNCTVAIQKSFQVRGVTHKFTDGAYLTTDSVSCEYEPIEMSPNAWLLVGHNRIGILLGYSGTNGAFRTNNVIWHVNAKKQTQSNWADSTFNSRTNLDSARMVSIGIYMRNSYACTLESDYVGGFTKNIVAMGEDQGVEHCQFRPQQLINGWYNFQGTGTGAGGYFNSNYIYGGNISRIGGVNSSRRMWGFVIGANVNDTYGHNHNTWENASFQFGIGDKLFRFFSGFGNTMRNVRSENNGSNIGVAYNNTRDSRVGLGYGINNEGFENYAKGSGGSNLIYNQHDLNISSAYTAYKWTAKGNVGEYDAANINISGTQITASSNGSSVVAIPKASATIHSEYVQWNTQDNAVGAIFNTTSVKSFVIKPKYDSSNYAGRLHVRFMDAQRKELPITSEPAVGGPVIKTTTFGGGWITQSDNARDWEVTAPPECKFIQILIVKGSSNMRLRELVIIANWPNTNTVEDVRDGDLNNRPGVIATQAPTSMGSYYRGQLIYRNQPHADSSLGWVCNSAGTFRTTTGATATYINSTNKMVVSGVNLDTCYKPGEWILYSGSVYGVIGRRGDTLLVNTFRSGGTLTALALNYATPTFVPFARSTNVESGTYSPSRGNFTNVTSSSVESFMYEMVGKIVSFSGRLKVTPSGAGATSLDLALPISTTLSSVTSLSGRGTNLTSGTTFGIQAAPILLNNARISFTATGTSEEIIIIDCRFALP